MSTNYHDMNDKMKQANEDNAFLDNYYSQWYTIEIVKNRDVDRLGIDRIFTHNTKLKRYSVEYKADRRAHETGNVFIEDVSVDTSNKFGWALTCCAQWLFYYIPQKHEVLRVEVLRLKEAYSELSNKYKTGDSQNETYKTKGLLVPISVFKKYCYMINDISKPSMFQTW